MHSLCYAFELRDCARHVWLLVTTTTTMLTERDVRLNSLAILHAGQLRINANIEPGNFHPLF
jgi:hypothetical protein